MSFRSTLYVGSVIHRRLRPRPHRLRYRVFWMMLDLDEIDALAQRLPAFSRNHFNAVSFYDRDHGDGSTTPLREQVERHLQSAGIELDGGPIRLFCMPRIFGYGFNPLSVYFCYRARGALAAILYEVHNTFRQRHCYLFAVDDGAGTIIEQHCQKAFYVSPFMDMEIAYAFRVAVPDQRIALAIRAVDADGPVLAAAVSGTRRALTNSALLRALVTHPLLTLKVIGAIHWHALGMWLKGFKIRPRPSPPEISITIGHDGGRPS